MDGRRWIRAFALAASAMALSGNAGEGPKPATPATIAAQRAAAAALPADDGRDAEFAQRGFIATRTDPVIKAADGRVVWNLAAYDFVGGASPGTVHPSLWRHMGLLRQHGLFKVSEGLWQVRGFDLSNMTLIAGKTGWIVIDPLTTREAAAAALELANLQLGHRPVSAVIYSHSHGDHYGGVRGVISNADVRNGKVAIIAPQHLVEEAVSENVLAGGAMGRRASFQFGTALQPGPQGQIGSGIGPALSNGEITLIAPTESIAKTGEIRIVDGIALEFQMVSGSEAPSEFNIYIAQSRTFLSAEMSTCSMHNILTPRGAKVRDARAWAGFLDEAVRLYGPRSEVLIASHCWPRFGQHEVVRSLAAHRDNYRYLHDQTVRLMNQGATQAELAEVLALPPALARDWFNRGYYGTYSHNSKAIYQFYLGWYDAVPANLHPHPPAERAKRLIAALGGGKKAIAAARKAMAAGDYRWSSDLLNQVVFAEPANQVARVLLADSYEQQGYQAESAIWRNQFLMAAQELRLGPAQRASNAQGTDVISAVPTQLLLDSVSTRFDPTRAGGRTGTIALALIDREENAAIELSPTTMIGRMERATSPAAKITGPRRLLLGLLFLKLPLAQLEAAGLKVEGDRTLIEAWLTAIDPVPAGFNIAEP